MGSVREFCRWEDLRDLRETWTALLAETHGADFFRTWEWLTSYGQHFGPDREPHVLLVREQGAPTGIVPLVVQPYASKLGRMRTLSFPLDSWGSFYGPVGANAEELVTTALDYFRSVPRKWDYIDLRCLDPSSFDKDPTACIRRSGDVFCIVRRDTSTAVADLKTTWESYWASRSKNWRSNCRRNLKKLQSLEQVDYVRYRPSTDNATRADPRWDLYEACEKIARSSWQGHSTDGTTLTHKSVRAFLRDVHARAAEAGGLDVNLLYVGGKPAAFNYNYVYRGHVSSLRLGFDADYKQFGAGTVLTYRMLQDSFSRGDHTLDFLPGTLSVKRPWQTHTVTGMRCESFPLGFGRVPLLHARHWIAQQMDCAKSWWRARSSLASGD